METQEDSSSHGRCGQLLRGLIMAATGKNLTCAAPLAPVCPAPTCLPVSPGPPSLAP